MYRIRQLVYPAAMLLLILLTACSPAGSATPTQPAPTLIDATVESAVEPTPLAFELSETEHVGAEVTATAGVPQDEAPELAAQALETIAVDSLPEGGFVMTISGSVESEFDSSSAIGVAEYVPEGGVLNFQFGRDASATPAEQVSITLPPDIVAATYAIEGSYGDTTVQGAAGALYDADGTEDTSALYATNARGAITITHADDETISGYFTFTAENPDGESVTVHGGFNRIARNPTAD